MLELNTGYSRGSKWRQCPDCHAWWWCECLSHTYLAVGDIASSVAYRLYNSCQGQGRRYVPVQYGCIVALFIKSSCLLDFRALQYWHSCLENTAEFTTYALLHAYCILTGFPDDSDQTVVLQFCHWVLCLPVSFMICFAAWACIFATAVSTPWSWLHNICCCWIYHCHRCSSADVCCRWHVGSLEDD